MKNIVRFIIASAMAIMVISGISGCQDPLSPKTQYRGKAVNNQTRFGVYVFIDGKQLTHYPGGESLIQPGWETNVVYLTGSAKHHCLAYSYPDPSLFRQEFDGVVDNVSKDRQFGTEQWDWLWRIGGSFDSCLQPVPPDTR